jgi:hypothetical protein
MSDKTPNLDSLFLAALEIDDPEERAAYLDRNCADNPALRAETERMLAEHAMIGSFLEQWLSALWPDPQVFRAISGGFAQSRRPPGLDMSRQKRLPKLRLPGPVDLFR